MKMIFTRVFDCGRIKARDLPDHHLYHEWMETLKDEPMPVSGSRDWLLAQHPKKLVYGLAFIEDKVEVVE